MGDFCVLQPPIDNDDLSYASGRPYTKILYVSSNGSGSDGKSWASAYTTIQDALDAASVDSNDFTLILIAPGTYDINTTGVPTWSANVAIIGSHRNTVIIKNDHGSASAVMQLSGKSSLKDVTIDCGSGSNDGLILTSDGARLENIYLEAENVTGAHNALEFSGSIEYVKCEDVMIHGVITHTKGVYLNDCKLSTFINFQIHECATGLHLDHADDDDNFFNFFHIHGCTLGVLIDAGIENQFKNLMLLSNTTNVTTCAGNHWNNPYFEPQIVRILPETASTGTVVSSKNVADTYADNYTQIDDGTTFTKLFKVVGMALGNPSDNTATYIVKIATGAAASEVDIGRGMHQANRFGAGFSQGFESGVIDPGVRVSANCQSENAVADTIQVWLQYIEI
jgi:hypothetical protein